ncbi:MAG: PLP-dependent aminotransferase family protein [Pyrinomonadaceae bacterium]|nr:PLP-dependent aminotransferase family protein [Pyrinomonadaceae bacterium]
MSKVSVATSFPVLHLDASSSVPLYRQIYEGLRSAILTGKLRPGARLPSTREMAKGLMVSRNTVMNAYDQLLAEGYLEGHVGSGTYVTNLLPDDLLHACISPGRTLRLSQKRRGFSSLGAILTTTRVNACADPSRARPFWPGIPALDSFPAKTWSRLLSHYWHQPSHELLGYGDPAGYWPLREAIATYLGAARAVQCSPEQVIITAGRQQAFDLVTRVLLNPGDAAWIEDPGYMGARAALLSAGARLIPVPVDEEGIDVCAGEAQCPDARLAYVSPSHQYPLGLTMSLSRRLALLEWAKRAGAWILEDDYDSEYRYTGRPLSALQGLDQEGRVIYIGTFSKVMFPALRLGYMIVPSDKIAHYVTARAILSRFSPMIDQAVLADFINEGHFERHIRRMRSLYKERQDTLVEALKGGARAFIKVEPDEAGLHLIGWLPEGIGDVEASARAAAYGVDAQPLSAFSLKREGRGGLILGYAGYNQQQIHRAAERLTYALRDLFLLRGRHAKNVKASPLSTTERLAS